MSQFRQSLVPIKRQIEELEFIVARSDVKTWKAVQEIVRAGLASKAFQMGDQFLTMYNDKPFTKDVIGINHDMPSDKRFEHSLTLQFHDCLGNVQFSAPQAFYNAETELPAGTHVFTLNNIKHEFTTTTAIPVGGVAYAHTWGDPYIPSKVTTYTEDRVTVIEADLAAAISEGEPTLTTINNHTRCRYGSNNYVDSAIRQWLNSEESTFKWRAQGLYDMPSISGVYAGPGFLKLLDPELVAVLGAVDKQVARNTVTDDGGQDLFSDKVFLLSRVEVFGGTEGTITGEEAYPYYSALAASPTTGVLGGRIKYLSGSARLWWLRSPYSGIADDPRYVDTSGAVSDGGACYAFGAAPACCIV